jgi:hypothetical protein
MRSRSVLTTRIWPAPRAVDLYSDEGVADGPSALMFFSAWSTGRGPAALPSMSALPWVLGLVLAEFMSIGRCWRGMLRGDVSAVGHRDVSVH